MRWQSGIVVAELDMLFYCVVFDTVFFFDIYDIDSLAYSG